MPAAIVNVLTHGYCFDGLVSAALFTRLLRRIEPEREHAFSYRSCGYGPKLKSIPKGWLSGEVNALLDFRYTENDRLTYYFDHHKTGFSSEREQSTAFERVHASAGRRKLHYDPGCSSCAKLIARVGADDYGVHYPDLAELIEWADRVDSARFDEPEEAFFARHPALVIADVIERHGDTAFLSKFVPTLLERSVDDVATSELVSSLAAPLGPAKEVFLSRVRQKGALRGDIAVVDLGEEMVMPAGKFATYVAFPTCVYSIVLLRTKDQLKLGVGFNPWGGKERRHDVASLCQTEGGGGHPVVGAVNYRHTELAEARAALERMVAALST